MNDSITITGRLGSDPQIRYTKTGKAVCDLSLAVNGKVKRGAGYVDSVTWHRVVLWQGLESRGVPVQIGRFTLRLSPLKRGDLSGARKAWHALAVAQLAPVASAAWSKAHSDALGFIFIAARQNNRGLLLAELDDEAEPEEIVDAFKALSELMHARWGSVWCWPGNAE